MSGGLPAAPVARSEADVLAGVVRMSFSGQDYALPVLKIKASREWKTKLANAMGTVQILDADQEGYTADWGALVANAASDQMVELIAAYDTTHVFGADPNDWLENNASDKDLWLAFNEVLKATFPFVDDPRSFLLQMLEDAMKQNQLERVTKAIHEAGSTNSSSTSGADSSPLTNSSPDTATSS